MHFLLFAVSMAAAPIWGQNSNKPTPSPSGISDSMQSGEITEAPLPDAPSASKKGPASVSGGVLDSSGAAVCGARVSLMPIGKAQARFVRAGADGRFIFDDVLPGSYVIVVEAKGLPTCYFRKIHRCGGSGIRGSNHQAGDRDGNDGGCCSADGRDRGSSNKG